MKYLIIPMKTVILILTVIAGIGLFSVINSTRIAINKISESDLDNKSLVQELKSCREELQKINQKLDRF